jgi:hypothetical protein
MKKLDPTMAQQVAQAISVFQEQRTGYRYQIASSDKQRLCVHPDARLVASSLGNAVVRAPDFG